MQRRISNLVSIGLLILLAGCGGGGGGGSQNPPPPPPPPVDTTPDTFAFTAQSGANPATTVASNEVTIVGINAAAAVAITGGDYSINGAAFTAAAGTISNSQRVQLRLSSSGQFATAASAVLTVGGVAGTFTATTRNADTTPDAFQFQGKVDTQRSTFVSSDPATITGIEIPVAISIQNGEYSIQGGAFSSAAGTISNNQTLRVRVTSSGSFATAVTASVTISGVAATFSATTRVGDSTPDAYQFTPRLDVARDTWISSAAVTLTGYEVPIAVSVENGEYSVAGGAFTSAAGTISPGETLTVRVRSSGIYSRSTSARVTAGGVSAAFEVTTERAQHVPSDVAYDGQDVIYLLYGSNRVVNRWSISAGHYLEPLLLGLHSGIAATMAYSEAHQRLYFGYDSADIRYLALNVPNPTEVQFASVEPSVIGTSAPSLIAAGNFLAAQENDFPFPSHYVFDATGAIKDHERNGQYSQTLAFDVTSSRVYYFRDGITPNDLHFDVIDQATGQITSTGDSPYHGQFDFHGPIRISGTGPYLLLGAGDLYDRTSLEWSGSVGFQVADARWMANGSLVTLTTDSNQTLLRRLDGTFFKNKIEQRTFAGTALRVFGTETRMAVLVNDGGTVRFHIYVPNDDSDLDGVPNALDAFPTDPAASVDTDRDGYPNAWNPGKTAANSTTGLTVLDAFPQDSACWLAVHGSGGLCNYSATVPAYVPDQVVQHGDTIYLLSAANRRIFRWSIAARAYINPYVVGLDPGTGVTSPMRIAYSASPSRLYLAYAHGAVRYVDVAAGSLASVPFASVAADINGLATVGNYVLVRDTVPPWSNAGARYLFAGNGTLTDRQASTFSAGYSRDYAWDPTSARVYSLTDNVSPNNLTYTVINQATGKFEATGQTPYHGTYTFDPPIRVSADGQRVLLGSGDFYQQSDLTRVATLGAPVVDARWMANGALTTLTTTGGQTTVRRLGSGSLSLLEHVTFAGQPLRVVGTDTQLIVLTVAAGAVQFHLYVPTDDIDGDGVPNAQDAFPTDPAASVDSDRDGYPNALVNGVPSTTGLLLDAFPQDAACWLVAHGSGGVCNYAATVPGYVPDQVFNDGNVVYLLSRANRRVYRWSIATAQYLDPYVVGLSDGATTTAPVRVAYSAAHQRLYVGYANGAIRYIAPGSRAEVAFAMLPNGLENLASVGNFLLVHDSTVQWATHYVFNAGGAITGERGFNARPLEYTWDPVSARVYFTRDSLTPNDLEYEVINQTSGAISSWGDSPYHGEFPVEGPVRVSANGERIIIGTGYVQDGTGLSLLGSIGKTIKDAHWKDHILVDVDTTDRVEIRDADTRAVLTFDQYAGQPLRLVFGSSEAYLVHVVGGTTAFQRLRFYDQDADQIPRWWEQLYGLSDTNAANAVGDLDADGVNNRNEYLGHSRPNVSDTDGDGLTDFQEIVTYLTNPANRDSDGDHLPDQAEVVTHHSNPLDRDSDDDTFDDLIEVAQGGNPSNASIPPQPLTNYTQSFEGSPSLIAWSTPSVSTAPWTVDTTTGRTGTASYKAGANSGGVWNSSARFRGYFAYGQIIYYIRIDGPPCCHRVELRVDGNYAGMLEPAHGQWQQVSYVLDAGIHEFEWRYRSDDDSQNPSPEAVYLDDITFNDF